MKRLITWLWTGLQMMFTFILLVVDRQLLVLLPFISSYSAQELSRKSTRYTNLALQRPIVALIVVGLFLLFRWMFF